MKSGTWAGLDAVALAHLGRADPGQRPAAALRLKTVVRSLTSWKVSRSPLATSARPPRASSKATPAARKSSAS